MDAYRTSALMCPICPNVGLRDFHGRLVCDECGGMLLDREDFVASLHEIDGSTDPLAVSDAAPAGKACPRCRRELKYCAVGIGELALTGELLNCTTDGIWVPRDAMTAAFARVSRRGGFRGLGATGGARGFGTGGSVVDNVSSIGNMPSGHSGMSGALASIAAAFGGGPVSSGLAISQWESRRPRVHTLYVSAHKDRRLTCPACKAQLAYHGDRWVCASCAGSFVENEALVAMIQEMAQAPWEPPPVTGAPGDRTCPVCEAVLVVEQLEGVTVDRCAVHGVWFDDRELEATLHHASAPPTGLGAWLRHLFGSKG